jgi:chemotaxis protein methyltransferase CheR
MFPDPPSGTPSVFDDDLFRRFCGIIHDETGLSFGDASRFFLEKRIETRMAARQAATALDYLHLLLYDADRGREWDALIAVITTNETYFMREERQLRCFQRDILPSLAEAATQRKVRIWSAGCSSGEEAYTIAMLVRETPGFPLSNTEIFATDINARVIQRAKEGIYGENSFRGTDQAFKRRWFEEVSPGHFRVADSLRQQVTFGRFNLFDTARYAFLSPFDVIFCRNVIIYFDLEAKVRVIERFHDKLRPGGYLLLGHSESLISITDKFRLVHLATDLVYVKEVS